MLSTSFAALCNTSYPNVWLRFAITASLRQPTSTPSSLWRAKSLPPSNSLQALLLCRPPCPPNPGRTRLRASLDAICPAAHGANPALGTQRAYPLFERLPSLLDRSHNLSAISASRPRSRFSLRCASAPCPCLVFAFHLPATNTASPLSPLWCSHCQTPPGDHRYSRSRCCPGTSPAFIRIDLVARRLGSFHKPFPSGRHPSTESVRPSSRRMVKALMFCASRMGMTSVGERDCLGRQQPV